MNVTMQAISALTHKQIELLAELDRIKNSWNLHFFIYFIIIHSIIPFNYLIFIDKHNAYCSFVGLKMRSFVASAFHMNWDMPFARMWYDMRIFCLYSCCVRSKVRSFHLRKEHQTHETEEKLFPYRFRSILMRSSQYDFNLWDIFSGRVKAPNGNT